MSEHTEEQRNGAYTTESALEATASKFFSHIISKISHSQVSQQTKNDIVTVLMDALDNFFLAITKEQHYNSITE